MPKVVIVADVDLEKLEACTDAPGTYMVYTEVEDDEDEFILDVTGASAELDEAMQDFFGDALKDGMVSVWSDEELLAEVKGGEHTLSFLYRVLKLGK